MGFVGLVLLGRFRWHSGSGREGRPRRGGGGLVSVATYSYSARPHPPRARAPAACARCLPTTSTAGSDLHFQRRGRCALRPRHADAVEGVISVLVVSDVDRLGRTIATAPGIVATLDDAGVAV